MAAKAHRPGRRTTLSVCLTFVYAVQHTVTDIDQIADALRGFQHEQCQAGKMLFWEVCDG